MVRTLCTMHLLDEMQDIVDTLEIGDTTKVAVKEHIFLTVKFVERCIVQVSCVDSAQTDSSKWVHL